MSRLAQVFFPFRSVTDIVRCPVHPTFAGGVFSTIIRHFGTTPVKHDIEKFVWPTLHNKMIQYFRSKPPYSTAVHIPAVARPRFYSDNYAYQDGYIPAYIIKYGRCRRILVKTSSIMPFAFDEADGHLSFHFKSRLYYLQLKDCVERVVVSDVTADTVERKLFQIQFHRYVPGFPCHIDVPVMAAAAVGSAGFRRGYHFELATPTVPCLVTGEEFPPPFQVNLSHISVKRGRIYTVYLRNLEVQLPSDRSVVFSPGVNPDTFEVAWFYGRGTLTPRKRSKQRKDPNFLNRHGRMIQLNRKGTIPVVSYTLKTKKKKKKKKR